MADHKRIGVDVQVRFRDLDAMGHVNNAVFFTYFEEARKAFIGSVLDIVEPSEYFFILARIECQFLKAVTLRDNIKAEVWIGKLGERSFTFNYAIVDREQPDLEYAKGESVQVFFDYKRNTTMPAPKDFIEKVDEYIEG